jgi:diacylglycerol kinase family enzyme
VGLGVANDRCFLFHVGVGFDAAVVERVERRHTLKRYVGHPLFASAAVATWLREYDHGHPRFRVELPGEEPIEGGIFAIVSKASPYTYFGSRRILVSPETGLDTALGLTVFRTRHTPTFLALAGSALASGRMLRRNPSTVHRVNLERLAIVGLGAFPWQADGEYLGVTERLDLYYRPDALTLVTPVPDPAP